MALTTLQFWQQQLAIHQAAQAATQTELRDAQAGQKTAGDELAKHLRQLDASGSAIAAMRARLAQTTIPADAGALVAQITAEIVRQRGLQGRVLDDREKLEDAVAAVDAAAAAQPRAAARVVGVQASIAQAKVDDDRRQALKQAIGKAPLATLKADAAAFKAGATVTDAASRLDKNFPAELRAIAGKRHDTRVKRLKDLKKVLADAQTALGAELAADNGVQGTVSQKLIDWQRAQDELARHVAAAAARYARAREVMERLQAIEKDTTGLLPDVLSAAEKTLLQDAALAGPGAAVEPAAEALDAGLNAVFAARDAWSAQVLTQIAADVDQLATDPTLAAKRAAIDTAQTTFKTDLAAHAAAGRPALDRWQAVVPDAGWQLLLDYLEGSDALAELSATDPVALAAAMDNAETAYVTALAAAAVAGRRIEALGDAIALDQEHLDDARAALSARLPSAVRGDSY